ncbi:MAG TPA: IclR family transcriptional regulator [Alphaproteobacteria bacterium]|nr:IclR family transcriptional regulator [Alphaproteobacteria bacterium]
MTKPVPQSNKATERILRVLTVFADEPRKSVGVTELSRNLGMTKNMAFRALSTLVNEGYLMRDPGGSRYELGYRAIELRNADFEEQDWPKICVAYMRNIHEITRETVTLSIRAGFHSVVIDGIEGRQPVVTRVLYGRPIPLHAGPGSRAILAFMADEEIEEFLAQNVPLAQIRDTTIVEPAALWDEIRLVRQRGYTTGYRDHIPIGSAIAFPVLDGSGHSVGAIAIGTADEVSGDARLQALLPALRQQMDELNGRTGASLSTRH